MPDTGLLETSSTAVPFWSAGSRSSSGPVPAFTTPRPAENTTPPPVMEEHLQPLPPPPPAAPTVRSEDGRLELTATTLKVDGRVFSLLELEAIEVKPVRWLLWYLLGGLTLAIFTMAFLQNWLRTMPAAMGMTVGALLLLIGHRGAKRLRILRLGQEDLYYTLSGELAPWQTLVSQVNRRIQQRHDEQAALLFQAVSAIPPSAEDTSAPVQ